MSPELRDAVSDYLKSLGIEHRAVEAVELDPGSGSLDIWFYPTDGDRRDYREMFEVDSFLEFLAGNRQ